MKKWTKFNKAMSWCVMISGIIVSIVFAIVFFMSAASLSSSYGGYGGYYNSAASAMGATYVWFGIGVLVLGTIFSLGVFGVWNMLISWYDPDSAKKAQPYAQPTLQQTPMYYAPPVQPASWQCPACGGVNNAESAFCYNCGKPRQ